MQYVKEYFRDHRIWAHLVSHRPIVPRTPWGRWMKNTISCIIIKMKTIGLV